MADNSIYQQAAQGQPTTEGPFTQFLQIHPGISPVGGPQYPEQGYPLGKAGVIANIGDTALRGLQRGRVLGYLMKEAQNNQKYNAGIQQFADIDRQIEFDTTLSAREKQMQHEANSQNRNAYVAYHWNERWQQANEDGDQGQGKGKGKKTKSKKPETQTAGTPSGMPEQPLAGQQSQQQPQHQELRQHLGNTLTTIFNHIAGPNMPTTAPANLDWVTARGVDVRKMRDPATLQDRQQTFLNETIASIKDKDQTGRYDEISQRTTRGMELFGQDWGAVATNLVKGGYTFEQQLMASGAKDVSQAQRDVNAPPETREAPPEVPREGPPQAQAAPASGVQISIPQFVKSQPTTPQLAYKNNNPLNLKFAYQPGATRSEGNFAKFATPEQGYQAAVKQIQLNATQGLTLDQHIAKWNPATALGNSPQNLKQYQEFVQKKLGVNGNTPLRDLDPEKVAEAQAAHESNTRITDTGLAKPQTAADLPQYLTDSGVPGPSPVTDQRGFKQSSIEPFLRDAKSYTPGFKAYVTGPLNSGGLNFKQPDWYLKAPDGSVHTILMAYPGGNGPALFYDQQRNKYVDTVAAGKAGWDLTSYDPEKRADHITLQTDQDSGNAVAVDLNTNKTTLITYTDKDGKVRPLRVKDTQAVTELERTWNRKSEQYNAAFRKIETDADNFKKSVARLGSVNLLMDPREMARMGFTNDEIDQAQKMKQAKDPKEIAQATMTLSDLADKMKTRQEEILNQQREAEVLEFLGDAARRGEDAFRYAQGAVQMWNKARAAVGGTPTPTSEAPPARDVDTSSIFIK